MLGINFETPNVIDAGDFKPSCPKRKGGKDVDYYDDDDDDRPMNARNRILKDLETRSVISTSSSSSGSSAASGGPQRFRGTKIKLMEEFTDETNNSRDDNSINPQDGDDDKDNETVPVIDEYYDDEEVGQSSGRSELRRQYQNQRRSSPASPAAATTAQNLRTSDPRLFAASILSEFEERSVKFSPVRHDSRRLQTHSHSAEAPRTIAMENNLDPSERTTTDILSSSMAESVSSFIVRTRNVHYWKRRTADRRYCVVRTFVQLFIVSLCIALFILVLKDNKSNYDQYDYNAKSNNTIVIALLVGIITVLLCVAIAIIMEWRRGKTENAKGDYDNAVDDEDLNDSLTGRHPHDNAHADNEIPQPHPFQSSTVMDHNPLLVGDTTNAVPSATMTREERPKSTAAKIQSRYDQYIVGAQRDEDGNPLFHVDL